MEKIRIEECCEILDSQRIPITASDRKKGSYPYYGANGIQDYVDNYIFDDELVLLAEDGGNFGSKERPIAYRVSGKCWVNNHAHVLKPKTGFDVDYLCYALMFYDVGSLVNGATRMKLTQAAMRQMTIPLKDLGEQKRIVHLISLAQTIIQKRRQQLAALDELVKARFVEMFGDPESNPNRYPIKMIGSLLKDIIPGWSANGESRQKMDDEKAVLKVSAVTQGYFKPEEHKALSADMEIKKYVYPHKGDLLFSRANTRELVGATAIIEEDYPDLLLPDKLWRVLFSDNLNVYYAKYVLSTDSIRAEFSAQSTGTSGSMFNVSAEKFRKIGIPVPPIEYQNEFEAFIHQVDKSKTVVQKALDETQLLFDSLMQEYFG